MMVVVAGPSGSGKSVRFSAEDTGFDFFNVDDRCARLHGSYHGIPPEVRQQAGKECEDFVKEHIALGISFATETTLSGKALAVEQAREANEAGFSTSMIYVGTGDVNLNIERVRLRGLGGGHSAPPEQIRSIYRESLGNLPKAIRVFHRVAIYDNSDQRPVRVLEFWEGRVTFSCGRIPHWIQDALSELELR